MNKVFRSIAIVATIVIAFGVVGSVFAQGPGEMPFDAGSRGGRGGQGFRGEGTSQGVMDGEFHDALIAAYAEALGITVEDLEARIAAGESLSEIAQSTGLSIEAFWDIKNEVRSSVIDQAVSDGTLTQEQADWMKTRGAGAGNGQGKRGLGLGDGNCPND
jgi:hypothetical protein